MKQPPCVVDDNDRQETITQLLCLYLGTKWGISPVVSGSENWIGCQSWENYWHAKVKEQKDCNFIPFSADGIWLDTLKIIQALDL